MNEIKKQTSKKNIVLWIIGIILVITIAICFIIALKNYKESTSQTNTSSTNNNNSNNYTSSLSITEGGTYKITGENNCILINTIDTVELSLENTEISCDNGPAIYIKSAEKVNIVLTGENTITATTTEELEGAIYSKNDLEFTGSGSLNLTSNYDGIVSKDDILFTNGTYIINSQDDGIKGRDSVEILDGTFNITSGGDGIKSTNDENDEKGNINIINGTFNLNCVNDGIQSEKNLSIKDGTFIIKTTSSSSSDSSKGIKAGIQITIDGGTFEINSVDDGIHSNGNIEINKGNVTINSKDDGIHADGMVEINDGTFNITAKEGIEGTYVKINNGTIDISATDDGINAGNKSNAYSVKIEINGGDITIKMGQGDTDGIDSNGDIYINGGTINITGQSPFDYDGTAKKSGGTIIVNGTTTNEITNQMMGGRGGMNGNPNGNMNGNQMGPRGNQRQGMR